MKRQYVCGLLLVLSSSLLMASDSHSEHSDAELNTHFFGILTITRKPCAGNCYQAIDSAGHKYEVWRLASEALIRRSGENKNYAVNSAYVNWGRYPEPVMAGDTFLFPQDFDKGSASVSGGTRPLSLRRLYSATRVDSSRSSSPARSLPVSESEANEGDEGDLEGDEGDARPRGGAELLHNRLSGDSASGQEGLSASSTESQSEQKISEEAQAKQARQKERELVQKIIRQERTPKGGAAVKPFKKGPSLKQVVTAAVGVTAFAGGVYYLYRVSHSADKNAVLKK